MTPAKNNQNDNSNVSSSNVNLSGVTYTHQDDKKSDATLLKATYTELHSGPLPHPQILAEYDKIIPDGAERLLAMAEKEQDSRIQAEKETRDINKQIAFDEIALKKTGQAIGFIVVFVFTILIIIFTFTGHEIVALGILGVGFAGIISAFMGMRSKKSSDK